MTDTPDHIKKIHLEIWLSRPPEERLRQFLINNEEMFRFWKEMRNELIKVHDGKATSQK